MIVKGDWVEWSFGGLAEVISEPFVQYKKQWVHIMPVNTGDPSTGTGVYTRSWPVDQLKVTSLDLWDYDPQGNKYTRRVLRYSCLIDTTGEREHHE